MDFVFLNFNSRTFPTSSSRHVPAVSDFNRFLFCSQFPVTIKKAKESRGCEKKEQVFRKLEAAEEVSIGIAAVLTRLDGIFALKDQQTKKKKALRPFFVSSQRKKSVFASLLTGLSESSVMQQRAKRLPVLVFACQWVHSVVFQTLSLGSFAKWVSGTNPKGCEMRRDVKKRTA